MPSRSNAVRRSRAAAKSCRPQVPPHADSWRRAVEVIPQRVDVEPRREYPSRDWQRMCQINYSVPTQRKMRWPEVQSVEGFNSGGGGGSRAESDCREAAARSLDASPTIRRTRVRRSGLPDVALSKRRSTFAPSELRWTDFARSSAKSGGGGSRTRSRHDRQLIDGARLLVLTRSFSGSYCGSPTPPPSSRGNPNRPHSWRDIGGGGSGLPPPSATTHRR